MMKFFLLIFCFALSIQKTIAQPFRLNEVMSSNGGAITDSDGDTSDWIEFYNSGATSVNLNGYGLTDKRDDPFQWIFPEISVNPGEYLLIFASGKDRSELPLWWNTLIASGDDWSYLVPTEEPTSNWRLINYSDMNWLTGKSGFGSGDNDDTTEVSVTKSIFLRKKFLIDNLATVRQLIFHMDYDDGFVAYLNGVEIAHANMDSNVELPRFDVSASDQHEALIYRGLTPERFEISNLNSILKTGENILAVQVHNFGTSSSDLSAIPFLSIATIDKPTNPRIIKILNLTDIEESELHTNFKISADGESVYLTNPAKESTDSVHVGILPQNASYGRTVKNPNLWAIFTQSTPKSENLGTEYSEESVGKPVFSIPGSVYSNSVMVKLNATNLGDSIFYTLNGSVPSSKSLIYKNDINITKSKVIKARIIKTGSLPGETVTNSYIIYHSKLPIVSLSMDSLDLWDFNTGIYVMGPNAEPDYPFQGANFWQDWEKPCHFEMIETTGEKVIDVDAGTKIFGNWSRGNAQKSMTVHCRKRYGPERMDYKIFTNRPFDEFYSIILRNSGNDWNRSMFRDGLMTGLTIGLNFDQMAYRPATIFLNGEYWGILNLREKIDENFLASNNNVNPDDIILLELNGKPVIGVADDWKKTFSFIENNSMTVTANYDNVTSQIDIKSFTDYFASEIFYANQDWPGNNIRYWKTTDPTSKWRWILYDVDLGMGIDIDAASKNSLDRATEPNGPSWPNPPWSTLILRKLLENTGFRNQFVNRFADLMNSTFLPERINKAINEKRELISDEMTPHLLRWNAVSHAAWLNYVERLKTFASARPAYVFGHISNKFGFQSQQIITVNTDSIAGNIQINSLKLDKFPWKGAYFPDVPVTVKAIPNAGYRFLRWEGVSESSNSETIMIPPKADLKLTAIFESDGSHYDNIVINEISFNSDATNDPGDWIEIYNKGKEDIDISGWKLTDSDTSHQFIFAPSTWIKSHEYLVISNNLTKMDDVFGSVKNIVGVFDFGLGSQTDKVQLFSQYSQLIDVVSYSNVVPWPTFDLTKLRSLELTNPANNNNSASSWEFSVGYGTPGLQNTSYIPDAIDDLTLPHNTVELLQNYPNPFNEGTYIEFKLDQPGKYRVSVLDLNGRTIRSLNDENQLSTVHSLYWDGRDNYGKTMVSGIYFYRLECEGFIQIKRMVKM